MDKEAQAEEEGWLIFASYYTALTNQTYISLVNLEPSQNKWRVYLIHVDSDGDVGVYHVRCSWGRLNQPRKVKATLFEDEKTMLKFVEITLKRRYRHGYQVFEKSAEFPSCPVLDEMQVMDNIAGQMRLF